MVDMATILREQIYSAVRAFTCATVAEAEAATKVIIRLVDNAIPDDGTCVRCGAAGVRFLAEVDASIAELVALYRKSEAA
jgi:hypothetical protein